MLALLVLGPQHAALDALEVRRPVDEQLLDLLQAELLEDPLGRGAHVLGAVVDVPDLGRHPHGLGVAEGKMGAERWLLGGEGGGSKPSVFFFQTQAPHLGIVDVALGDGLRDALPNLVLVLVHLASKHDEWLCEME